MQKLSHALRILSETEKQLRISKNQTTWFTAGLLQLSSIEYSSVDANDTKLCMRAASGRGRFNFFLRFFFNYFPSSLVGGCDGFGRNGVWSGLTLTFHSMLVSLWVQMVIYAVHLLLGRA